MPTYQYACTDCGEQLEVVQSFTADPLTECPACGGRLRKVFHPVGVVFKGSGFYRTDSRGSGTTKAGSGTTTGSKDAATSGSSAGSPTTGGSGSSSTSPSGSTSGSSSSSSGGGSSSSSGGSGSSAAP